MVEFSAVASPLPEKGLPMKKLLPLGILAASVLGVLNDNPAVAQSGLMGDQYTISGWNFPTSFGITTDADDGETVIDHGSPPVTLTFDGVAETAGGLSVNERVVEWPGVEEGIFAVQAAGVDGETEFFLDSWMNAGEIVEFSFSTLNGGWLSQEDEFGQSGYSIAGLDWANAEPGTMPLLYTNGFYLYVSRDGVSATGYATQIPELGLLVGAHPFDDSVSEVVYIAYSQGQVDRLSNLYEGGMDFNGTTTQLDEDTGSWDLLAFALGMNGFFTGMNTPANALHVGFLVTQPTVSLLDGDANGDGMVNLTDFNILKSHFGQAGGRSEGDFTGDGNVDLADFNVLKANFGQGGAAVPEPGTMLLAGLAVLGSFLVGAKRLRH